MKTQVLKEKCVNGECGGEMDTCGKSKERKVRKKKVNYFILLSL